MESVHCNPYMDSEVMKLAIAPYALIASYSFFYTRSIASEVTAHRRAVLERGLDA